MKKIVPYTQLKGDNSEAKKSFKKLETYIGTFRPLIYMCHYDFAIIDSMVCAVSKSYDDTPDKEIVEYVCGAGIVDFNDKDSRNPTISLADLLRRYAFPREMECDVILLLKNVHYELENPEVQSLIRLLVGRGLDEYGGEKCNYKTYVIIASPLLVIPPALERYINLVTVGLPGEMDIQNIIKNYYQGYLGETLPSEEVIRETALIMMGMSKFEIEQVLHTIWTSNENLSNDKESKINPAAAKIIIDEKKQLIRKSGLLKIEDTDLKVSDLGGLENLSAYLDDEEKIFKDLNKAKDFGVDIPKGILIVGMPGCGKSLTAKITASKFNVPLICLDIGKLMGPYVGQSEENMRRALQTVEAASPCVLWIDELEKAFAGVTSTGSGGSEVTTRLFGSFLTWMQEKRDTVYVIATANRISSLPPEFKRKGRFDEIFQVDFPTESERKKIFEIHWNKRNEKNTFASPDFNKLARKTDGFCGADIESVVSNVFKRAFIDGKKNISTEDFMRVIENTTPLKKSLGNEIQELSEEFKKHNFRPASSNKK